jgi:CRISPR-associated exonuclease Cas4
MAGISAGDLEKFCYCPLSWQLRDHETREEGLDQGLERHERMADELQGIVRRERRASQYERLVIASSVVATALALVGLFLFASTDNLMRARVLSVLALLWILLAVTVLYKSARTKAPWDKEKSELGIGILAILAMVVALNAVPFFGFSQDQGLLAEAIALLLLMTASVALYLSHTQAEGARKIREITNVKGRITYIGEGGEPRTLRSEEFALAGRPDYILEVDGELVPVEVKTGRVPRGPLFSHIIQLAAYCLLLEQEGKVSYGILRYGKVEHVIEFDQNLRTLLLTKLAEMRTAIASGITHRDHDRPGKCRSCSRRDGCPERLD